MTRKVPIKMVVGAYIPARDEMDAVKKAMAFLDELDTYSLEILIDLDENERDY